MTVRCLRESVRQKWPKNGGMATGSCTTTMCPYTLHILCSSFWPNTAPLSCGSHHTHHISHRVTFSYSQCLRKFWKDADLRQRRTSNEIRWDTIRHPERGVRKMFPAVAAILGEVCSCGRELCWRQLGLKPRKLYLLHVLWSVRILFEQTSMLLWERIFFYPVSTKSQCSFSSGYIV